MNKTVTLSLSFVVTDVPKKMSDERLQEELFKKVFRKGIGEDCIFDSEIDDTDAIPKNYKFNNVISLKSKEEK